MKNNKRIHWSTLIFVGILIAALYSVAVKSPLESGHLKNVKIEISK